MKPKRREEILQALLHFKLEKVSQEDLDKFTRENGYEPINAGEFTDYILQYKTDKKAVEYLKKVTDLLTKLEYLPEFELEEKRKEIAKNNEEVEIEIAKKLEDAAIPFFILETFANNVNSVIRQTVESSHTRILNKTLSALIEMAKDKYGEEFNTKHAKQFFEEKFAKK